MNGYDKVMIGYLRKLKISFYEFIQFFIFNGIMVGEVTSNGSSCSIAVIVVEEEEDEVEVQLREDDCLEPSMS